jgi:hypothetical protein
VYTYLTDKKILKMSKNIKLTKQLNICKYCIAIIICTNILLAYYVINVIRNEQMKNAILQAEIRSVVVFNHEYLSRNGIEWKNYVKELDEHLKKRHLSNHYYIRQCKLH